MMSGWKTWLAVIGGFALGIYYFVNGDITQAWQWITFALALLGIGSKIDKVRNSL